MLIDALTRYEGTLLFVSHNRSFVNGLATQVWEVKEGSIDAQLGDLDDWARRRAGEPAAGQAAPAGPHASREARRERALQREQRQKMLGPIKRDIAQLEEEKRRAEAQLADPALFADSSRSTPLVNA